jgi:hypothetical protein
MANGLQWLPDMGLSNYRNDHIILQLLVDQIVFESASLDLNGPLECTQICLQMLRGSKLNREKAANISHLWDALIWILQKATQMRNIDRLTESKAALQVPAFAQIGIRKTQRNRSPGQIRSFEFAREMSNEEWDEWSNRIKSMAMGTKLRGLGCGPTYTRHGFVRDPDGICGRVSSA